MERFASPDDKPRLSNGVGSPIDIGGEMRDAEPLMAENYPLEPTAGAVGERGEPAEGNPHDMQIDPDTGLPVHIAPDGAKQDLGFDNDNAESDPEEPAADPVPEEDKFRIDPESRIPRPVQPDLA